MKLTPYYDKDGITIYCGDCLEIMPVLGLVFDVIIADLPFSIPTPSPISPKMEQSLLIDGIDS